MAAALVEQMTTLTLKEEALEEPVAVLFKVPGLEAFELELPLSTAVREVKRLAKEACGVEPEHMRLIYDGRVLKEADTLECYSQDAETPVQIHYTAGHAAMVGGGSNVKVQRNPFSLPVRGLPGSKGHRQSRMSGRLGGMGLIRKYGILMKRQEFREKAEQIGFVKYR
eukprot:SRR837773.22704.p2 GENE.SRR837773.22704~~SRR837773.22704.p2  ORF type:complete len:177 (+),score=91.63 SRR837773.22704:29-532(+)